MHVKIQKMKLIISNMFKHLLHLKVVDVVTQSFSLHHHLVQGKINEEKIFLK
jgi:hypothetical protein